MIATQHPGTSLYVL